ncbi:MAG: YkoF family thiamine/hydroxymethylpyrimidine-binding protein [Cyclobacteriaceae bacterium]
MKATAELSLYPLDKKYESIIIEFIKELHSVKALEVVTNGMSTQVFGTIENILDALKEHLPYTLQQNPAVLVMKLAPGHLKPELLPKEIQ